EGQRRYVETFSPYARQFLDRMDKPQVESISGIPPAIAIDQTNPVRTSRSTVGTMTELNDHLKLLFARAAALFCRRCGELVRRDTADSIYADLCSRARQAGDPRLLLSFPVPVPANFTADEVRELLARQGYTRFLGGTVPAPPPAAAPTAGATARRGRKRGQGAGNTPSITLEVVQDRLRAGSAARRWVIEGEGAWTRKVWYGVKRFFAWLETRAYKMHVRVLLSRYRAYTPCAACDGARLKSEALLWRLGTRELADAALGPAGLFR